MSWTAWQLAIVNAVKASASAFTGEVIWNHQNEHAPDGQHVVLGVISAEPIGMPEVRTMVDPGAAAGEEIVRTVGRMTNPVISVEVYRGATSTTTQGDGAALALATTIATGLYLPTVKSILNTAGLGLLSTSGPINIAGIIAANFEPRAAFELQLDGELTASETTGYIETVQGLNGISGQPWSTS